MDNNQDEEEDLNVSYSDTSSDGGSLSSPPPRMIKVLRRRCFVKGQGWTLLVVQPKAQINKITKLIGVIQDEQLMMEHPWLARNLACWCGLTLELEDSVKE